MLKNTTKKSSNAHDASDDLFEELSIGEDNHTYLIDHKMLAKEVNK